ncbi:MAG: DNA translocase FtsK [Nitrospirota bacterium]|nr:DNA translocase FtsK [Nitrospirota bacterium]
MRTLENRERKTGNRLSARDPREQGLLKEVVGILLLASATLMVVSLASYRVDDPSWTSSGIHHATADGGLSRIGVRNLAGSGGALLADSLIQLFGACAYFLPILVLAAAVTALKRGEIHPSRLRLVGWLLFFVATPALMDLWGNTVWTLADGRILFGHAGGLTGDLINAVLLPGFAPVGTTIVVLTLFLLALVMGPALTLRTMWHTARTGALALRQYIEERRTQPQLEVPPAAERRNHRVEPDEPHHPVPHRPTPRIAEPAPPVAPAARQADLSFMREPGSYQVPSLDLLSDPVPPVGRLSKEELLASAQVLEKKLADYGVEGKVMEVHPGPVVTMYEFSPAPGVKVSKIAGLADDLALAMSATRVRIEAPIPGKNVVGVEIPNSHREMIAFKELLQSPQFSAGNLRIPLALGKDIFGAPVVTDLAVMPHLLVAGSTGSGKSVGLNSMILSIIYSSTPEQVKLAMVDPKMLELSVYDGIPHLIHPVITRPQESVKLLKRMVIEMMRRYQMMQLAGVRNIVGYNEKVNTPEFRERVALAREETLEKGETPIEHGHLPYIVVIVDELADLMAVAQREIEEPIARLAQMARAAGIHLILATQRPSVDVITGLIKANFPSRIAFQVTTRTDSRTILDGNGAEALLGKGDMLFMGSGSGVLRRVHGAFVSDAEVHQVVDHIKQGQAPQYQEGLLDVDDDPGAMSDVHTSGGFGGGHASSDERDVTYDKAIALVAETGKASASFIQRRMRIGYPRAARIIELMEEDGIVGPADGSRPRQILIRQPGEQML